MSIARICGRLSTTTGDVAGRARPLLHSRKRLICPSAVLDSGVTFFAAMMRSRVSSSRSPSANAVNKPSGTKAAISEPVKPSVFCAIVAQSMLSGSRLKLRSVAFKISLRSPNVGKSTLFNRLTRSRRSIVGDEPGITRDRIYGEFEWSGRRFRLVDTGGIIPDDPELIPTEIFNQAKVALGEADALVLVTEWPEFASLSLTDLAVRMNSPVLIDGRNLYSPEKAADAHWSPFLVTRR